MSSSRPAPNNEGARLSTSTKVSGLDSILQAMDAYLQSYVKQIKDTSQLALDVCLAPLISVQAAHQITLDELMVMFARRVHKHNL